MHEAVYVVVAQFPGRAAGTLRKLLAVLRKPARGVFPALSQIEHFLHVVLGDDVGDHAATAGDLDGSR